MSSIVDLVSAQGVYTRLYNRGKISMVVKVLKVKSAKHVEYAVMKINAKLHSYFSLFFYACSIRG